VQTALEMRAAVLRNLERATIAILTAAVADYAPARPAAAKLKREAAENLTLELVRNPDILREVVERAAGRTVVGFAAETDALLANARTKLARKGCHLIVANDVSRSDIGFDSEANEVAIIGPAPDEIVRVQRAAKLEVAERILSRVVEVRRR
jgi:phosphopantothenoylcysteine decarboxylase/phosphopantothenate--cysteine ligase